MKNSKWERGHFCFGLRTVPAYLKILRDIRGSLKAEGPSYLILFLIFLFHLINNFIVVGLDNTPLTFDSYEYYANAKSLFYYLKFNVYRPPMLSFLMFPLFTLFGVSQKLAMLGVGSISLCILFFATFLLAKELHSKEAGLLSVFILSSCPIIFGHSRTTMSDLMAMGWLVFSLVLMVQPRAFTLLRFTIVLGVVMGLGMLTRVAFPLYIAGPLIYLLKKESFNKKVWLNLLLILVIIFLLCSFWYIPHFYQAASRHVEVGAFHLTKIGDLDDLLDMVFGYIIDLLQYGMGIVILPLFFMPFFKRDKKGLKWLSLLLIWIIVPWLILSLLDFKNARFVMPVLPAVVIIYSFLVLDIKKTLFKRIVIFIIVIFGISQTLAVSYARSGRVMYPLLRSYSPWVYQQFGLLRPWREDWKIKEIANVLKDTYPGIKKEIVFIKMRPAVTAGLMDMMYKEITLGFVSLDDKFSCAKYNYLSKVRMAHIVLFGEASFAEEDDEAAELFTKNISNFELINVVVLSDGSQVKIYKRLGKAP